MIYKELKRDNHKTIESIMDFKLIDSITNNNLPLSGMRLEGNILHTAWGSVEKDITTTKIYKRGQVQEIKNYTYHPLDKVAHLISENGFQHILPNTSEYNEALPQTIIKGSKIYEQVGKDGLKLQSSIQFEEGYRVQQMSLNDDFLIVGNQKLISRGKYGNTFKYHNRISIFVKINNVWKLHQTITDENLGQIQSWHFVGLWLVISAYREDDKVMLHFYRLEYHEFKHKQIIPLDIAFDRQYKRKYPKIYFTFGVCIVINTVLGIYHLKNNRWEQVQITDEFLPTTIRRLPSEQSHLTPKIIFIGGEYTVDICERKGDNWQFVFRLIDITKSRKEFMNFVKIKDDLLIIGESDKVSMYRMYYDD